jgi:NAD(P)-dependent dehydrogenase (short-subunit alcohol dehydrogenase family)
MSQTIFITGASSGIGRASAELFAERGWNVVATMRNPADGSELASRDNVLVTRLDLLDTDSISSAVEAAVQRFGGIDVLLNNAGYGAYGPLEATPMDVIRRQFDVNVFGLVETIQAVLPGMRQRRTGTIVNVSSVGGRVTYPLGTLYHGSKWAVEGLSEALHFELLAFGIRVKIVEPGGVRTDFSGRSFVFTHDPELADYQPMVQAAAAAVEQAASEAQGSTPTGQQEPEEVAEVIWAAATDGTDRMRYVSGDGAATLLSQRYSAEQDEAFVAGMRAQFGL